MKRFVLLIVVGSLAGTDPSAYAAADPEVDAIRAVAEAYISADPARLREGFLPTMNLYTTDEKEALRTIPFAEYLQRVTAQANAAPEERQATIDLVDRTGNAAIVKVTTLRRNVKVTDYLSLVRVEKQWKVVNKTFFVEPRNLSPLQTPLQATATDEPCSAPDHHRFDFMLGTWHAVDPGNAVVASAEGESAVEPMLDGCIVHERRSLSRQGKRLFDGDAYWGYDSTTKRWLLFYMDDQSHMQVYEGREETGHLAFYRKRPDPDGKIVLIRIVYAPAGASGYTQAVERSSDQGATWQPAEVTTYQSKR